jgi:RNA polymerase sigma-70 factor (ECF subfamily)
VVNDEDQALVERWRNGDRNAFAELVARYQWPLYNVAYRVLGNAEDASEITQAVFVKVAERLNDYDPRFKFFSWIYRISINDSINLLRRNGREEPLGDDVDLSDSEHAEPEARMSAVQQSARIHSALMGMKLEHRVVLTLRHFSDCSYREIGNILELDEKTVKSRLFEARQRLRELLKDLN